MKKLYFHKFDSSIGKIHLASTDKGVFAISFGKKAEANLASMIKKDCKGCESIPGGAENKKAEKQIKAYLGGRLRKFNLKLDIKGTPFQIKALKKVASIPYGKVTTYGQIAAAIGHPKASRAVGGANAKNRLPLVIPCHRVVATNCLGGYSGGLELKRRLLKLEGVKL